MPFSETATISRDFTRHGFEQVDYRDQADVYVLNTCSVTENADKEARKLIRQAKFSILRVLFPIEAHG